MHTHKLNLLCVSALLYYSGLIPFANWLHRHSGRKLLVLNYHQASGGELRRHLLYLRKHFRLQFVDQALEALYATGEVKTSSRSRQLPLAITFDDGYADNYTVAYRLARELQVPITIFLISNYIGNGGAYWWFDHLVEKTRVNEVTIDGHTYHLKELDEQQKLAQVIDVHINSMADAEKQQAYLHRICRALSVSIPGTIGSNGEPVSLLTWEQVQEMKASHLVAFGGHTLHHATLATLTNMEEARKEVEGCRLLLQEKLGLSLRVFAYPHGGVEHIEAHGVLAVQQAGYQWALTTIPGSNTPKTHPYLIRRMSADSHLHWLIIALMTCGIWDFLSYCNWLMKRFQYRKILKKMGLVPISLRQ